jgi:hypothetical protein
MRWPARFGTVYQAANWIYLGEGVGRSKGRGRLRFFNRREGRWRSERVLRKRRLGLAELRSCPEWIAEWTPDKGRYVWFEGSRREKRALKRALKYAPKPYPKRRRVKACRRRVAVLEPDRSGARLDLSDVSILRLRSREPSLLRADDERTDESPGAPRRKLQVGALADLVVVAAASIADAVTDRPPRSLVLRPCAIAVELDLACPLRAARRICRKLAKLWFDPSGQRHQTGQPRAPRLLSLGAGFVDAWSAANGADPGYTCCQNQNLLNFPSTLNQRIDLELLRGAIGVDEMNLVGDDAGDRLPSGLWPADHAGAITTLDIPEGSIAVPESSTWIMMLLGFVALGFAGWRARSQAPASEVTLLRG